MHILIIAYFLSIYNAHEYFLVVSTKYYRLRNILNKISNIIFNLEEIFSLFKNM